MIAQKLESLEAVSNRIRERARALGFEAVGIAPLGPSQHAATYVGWAEAGYAGEMGYLTRPDAVEKRANPERVVAGARSAIVVAKNYFPGETPGDEGVPAERGVFARYARHDDYHEILTPRLIELQNWIAEEVIPAGGRAYVDTGPVLERELARRAGIGWFGRNTMLIQPRKGSYFFLGAVLVDVELAYDEPFTDEFCGTCSRCLRSCPT
jgi:epoxyqueuosine reductase